MIYVGNIKIKAYEQRTQTVEVRSLAENENNTKRTCVISLVSNLEVISKHRLKNQHQLQIPSARQ